jgi:UPF0755 protein
MRWLKFLLALLILGGGGVAFLYYRISQPYARFEKEVFLDIPRGTSTRGIAEKLTGAGVIESPWLFLVARGFLYRAKLQAGEYRFAAPASPLDVYRRIVRGDIYFLELTIPEGFNMFDIGGLVEQLGLMSSGDFLAAARDPSLIRDLDAGAPTLEGYLFPDTYRVTRHTSPRELCRILTQRFRAEWKKLNGQADVHQTVTLASLVEREAAAPEDRPLVASVFHNRLKIGMKLDCDPTTVYAALLEGRYRGKIYRSDLASPNLFNTYQNAGLPPGPIANPGIASLKAALAPAESGYLYFVVQPDGSRRHQFSTDIAAHRAAASRYRRGAAK